MEERVYSVRRGVLAVEVVARTDKVLYADLHTRRGFVEQIDSSVQSVFIGIAAHIVFGEIMRLAQGQTGEQVGQEIVFGAHVQAH